MGQGQTLVRTASGAPAPSELLKSSTVFTISSLNIYPSPGVSIHAGQGALDDYSCSDEAH